MAHILEGKPRGKGLRIGVVVGRFNSFVTDKLLEGALDALERTGVDASAIEVVRVPGSFEIPQAAMRLGKTGRVDAVVCLGAIIKGETPHWDYLAGAVSSALAHAALSVEVPLTFGVLTSEHREQALERAGPRGDNKGYDAAMAAVEMANLYRELRETGS
jgi:6,7-dimethyl-8-ribityllumazine synthase